MSLAYLGKHATVGAALCLAVAVGTTGCGLIGSASSSSIGRAAASTASLLSRHPLAALTSNQITTKAISDTETASSVHIAGWSQDSGTRFTLGLTVGADRCVGTVSAGSQGSFYLLRIGKALWIRPDTRFWKSAAGVTNPADLRLVSGKYLKMAISDNGSVGQLCNLRQLGGVGTGQMTEGITTDIDGQLVLEVRDAGDGSSAFVTMTADPRIVRIEQPGQGQLDFTAYDAPLNLTPPPASEVLNVPSPPPSQVLPSAPSVL